jgi:hypothetical protein
MISFHILKKAKNGNESNRAMSLRASFLGRMATNGVDKNAQPASVFAASGNSFRK